MTIRKPFVSLTGASTLFGTSEAVAHRDGTLTDQRIADMDRKRLMGHAFGPDGAVRQELYAKSEDGRTFTAYGIHRARIALQFFDGEIDPVGAADCPYAKQVNAKALFLARKDASKKRAV